MRTGPDDRPGAEASPRGLDALVPVLAAEFPVYVFGTLRTYNGVSLSARHKDGAAGTGVYAVITSDPGEMRRALRAAPRWQPMTAGRYRGGAVLFTRLAAPGRRCPCLSVIAVFPGGRAR